MRSWLIIGASTLFLSACNGSDQNESEVSEAPSAGDNPPTVEIFEPSVAMRWNQVLLEAIRNDFARPTVHARNLFHMSAAMYDAWAAFHPSHDTYLLAKEQGDYACRYDVPRASDSMDAQLAAISYAAYRLIEHRFYYSPGADETNEQAQALMADLGLDVDLVSTDFDEYGAAALGNYIAQCYIEFGLQDGANEAGNYANRVYQPKNGVIVPTTDGNPNYEDYHSWQPISLSTSIDQAGHVVANTPEFLSPEWGTVHSFSLTDEDKTSYQVGNHTFDVYFDPKAPPILGQDEQQSDFYRWNFELVAKWSAHLAVNADEMIDISPNNMGNITHYPSHDDIAAVQHFYEQQLTDEVQTGYELNPITNAPYAPQQVPLGDFTRVLAEFWADGPDSETPPGHWFVIMNHVFADPQFERRWQGEGAVVAPLEWDIKAYFTLAAAMHDSAISAWSIKGYYDYLRPISALRILGELGQSSNPSLANYHPLGVRLEEGKIELITENDPLVGEQQQHLNKVKVFAWRGPDYISDPSTSQAGVGWIRLEQWWPYQRPSFVSPPFAGYISGHSTYSNAAAGILTQLTGSAYFPGGMSDFVIEKNNFLVFEQGPSVDLALQWATYQDAADQCSLSRIWGGIHPPIDDLPGRAIGKEIANRVFNKASSMFAQQ